MEIPKEFKYFAYDADGMGRKVGQAVLDNNVTEMRRISKLINSGHALIERWVRDHDGIWINGGGDEGAAAIKASSVQDLEAVRKDYEFLVGATISIGVGNSPSEAGRALLVAKLKGKNQIVKFTTVTDKEIKAMKKRAKKGIFRSMEEYKLSGAYLNKSEVDCVFCQQTDGVDPDHCQLCHDMDSQEGQDDCPLCAQNSGEAAGIEDCSLCAAMEEEVECPFCEDVDSLPNAPGPVAPTNDNEDNYYVTPEDEAQQARENDQNPPEIGKQTEPALPQQADQNPDPEAVAGDTQAIDPEDNHTHDALVGIAEQIESEGTPNVEQMDAIDDTQLPVGQESEGNISRPGAFGQDTPGDMGSDGTNPPTNTEDPNDEPDFSDILETGLNNHSETIRKEKALQTVTQALSQFKQCKDMLEQSKQTMPQLYQASISMLRGMIEMATLLGLGGQSDLPQELGQEQAALTPEVQSGQEWSNPFPAHPDHGGEKKPGHSPAKEEADGAIGQSAAKLSAKHTTQHIARESLPVGAVNAKGQQKVMDNNGSVRFIDRKNGMVQGASGVPVKPPSRG